MFYWPENKVSGNFSSCAVGEVKQKCREVSNLCGTSIQGVEEIQGLTMVVVEKSNNKTPWRLSPEHHFNWNRLIRIISWVVRFVNNCRIDREHTVE